MTLTDIKNIVSICGEDCVFENEPLSKHTSFRIGGPAEVFCTPKDEEALIAVLEYCDKMSISRFILGNGTNILASDDGFKGVVIQIYKQFDKISIEGTTVNCQAGILLSTLSNKVYNESLTGMEFANGIPGTLGGAVTMNAGAYGGEIKDVLKEVKAYVKGEGIKTFSAREMKLSYRDSIVKHQDMIVLSAVLSLKEGNKEAIKARMDELKEQRTSKQPLEFPSAGSTFKRPEGHFAGKLIMDAGLKGYSVGGACVSEKHAGFVINKGGATSNDVKTLMKNVSDIVFEKYNVLLEPEVLFLG